MELLTLTQMRNPTEEQKAKYEELKKKYNDCHGMAHIYTMIQMIEHELADNRVYKARVEAFEVHKIISLENTSYWNNKFKNDFSSEEAQNIMDLALGLKELIESDN
jgi:predicted glycoside hydrolase/deacetylase ChbG (UPF0249 family)